MRWLRSRLALTRALLVALSLAPACLLIILILRYGVDVPVWDEWEYVSFFEEFSRGTLTFAQLFAQQNEYRQFFPNLIFLGLGWLTRWDLRYEMLVSFALACLVSFNIYRMGTQTLGGSPTRRLTIYALANLLIFSPVQYDNWLQGMQLIYFMPVACITTCLVVAYTKLDARVKFALCMCLAAVSTFSSANGILCWFVVLPVLVWTPSRGEMPSRGELWEKRWLVSAWAIGFLLCVALYFDGYRKPPHHPGLLASLSEPLTASLYFLVLLGKGLELGGMISLQNPMGTKQVVITSATGLTLATLFVVSLLYIGRDSSLIRRAGGWLMLGAYSLMSAALVTFGRAGFGVEQAFAPRYTTLTLYLVVALVYLLPIVFEGRATEREEPHVGKKRRLLQLLGGVLLVSHLLAYALGIRQMSAMSARFSQAKACLLFIDIVRADCLTKTGYADVEKLRRAANVLDALGFLRPPLIRSARVQDISGGAAGSVDARAGVFASVEPAGEGVYTASGWAVAPERGEPADAVLLTYERASADSVVFTLGDTGEQRGVVARTLGRASPDSYARWQKSFTIRDLPANPVILNAWSFDAHTGKATKLDGTHVIQNPKAAISRK